VVPEPAIAVHQVWLALEHSGQLFHLAALRR
jgi:hypothetical protein